ncbi:MAG: sigma-70 family RNA polymerase sigma factor [Desulfomonile tiedjei]|nr:sigma-70 family RNA polymerase sigma factor [Desulfomonile tiedjei]
MARQATMNAQSDEDLIQALGNGDENALRVLVDRHSAAIYRFSIRFTGDESLAQDIAQEVFLRLYRHARRFVPGTLFKTWLFTIVRNTSIDLARSYTYRKAYSLDEYSQEPERTPPLDADPDPEERYLSEESAHRVAQAVQSLPEKQRTAVILRYYEGLSAREIAGIMRSTVASVESLLVRAKRSLLKLLEL